MSKNTIKSELIGSDIIKERMLDEGGVKTNADVEVDMDVNVDIPLDGAEDPIKLLSPEQMKEELILRLMLRAKEKNKVLTYSDMADYLELRDRKSVV